MAPCSTPCFAMRGGSINLKYRYGGTKTTLMVPSMIRAHTTNRNIYKDNTAVK